MKNLMDRLDEIINVLKTKSAPDAFIETKFEIRELLVDTIGMESDLFKAYSALMQKTATYSDLCKAMVGIVNGLKDYLQWKQISEKRYQFFISSTFQDLENYRKAVADEITFKGHFYAGMEDFTACGDDLEAYIKREIDKSDYYILLIGQRWGTALPEDENTSYTMMEYNYAKSKGMRIIPMIYNGAVPLNGNDLEINKKRFDKFVSEIAKTTPQYFKEENELIRKISKAIDNAIKNYPQKGWIRL